MLLKNYVVILRDFIILIVYIYCIFFISSSYSKIWKYCYEILVWKILKKREYQE